MSIDFPESRQQISSRMKSDVKSQLPESNPFLRNSVLQAFIFAIAGRIFDLFRVAKNLLKQLFWDTATGDYLIRHAAVFGITKNPATGSTGPITVEGIAGTSIPALTELQSTDGYTYEVDDTKTISLTNYTIASLSQSSGIATAQTSVNHIFAEGINVIIAGANEADYNGTFEIINIPASNQFQYSIDASAAASATGSITGTSTVASLDITCQDTGEATNQDSGSPLNFTSPIAGVEDTAYVQFAELGGGSDLESEDDFRDRFLFRVQNPVALFNGPAIINQAREVSGVTRVWVFNVDDTQGALTASSLTNANNLAIFTTASAHGLLDGQKITVTGATQTEYNVTNQRIIVISSTAFAYPISGSPASPATGSPVAAYSLVQEGQVQIYFVRDNDDSIIPSVSEINTVKDKILEIKPAHISDSDVVVQAPTAITVNFVFNSITTDSSTMRTAIENNLEQFFKDETEVGEDITLNSIIRAIGNTVDPETNEQLTSFELTSPAADVTISRGEIGNLGSITF